MVTLYTRHACLSIGFANVLFRNRKFIFTTAFLIERVFPFLAQQCTCESDRAEKFFAPERVVEGATPTDGRFTYPIYCVGFDNCPYRLKCRIAQSYTKEIECENRPSVGVGALDNPLQPKLTKQPRHVPRLLHHLLTISSVLSGISTYTGNPASLPVSPDLHMVHILHNPVPICRPR